MWRFARSPRWILAHLVVLAAVVVMVNLGLWQLRRLDERSETNDTIRARAAEPVVDVRAVIDPAQAPDDAKPDFQWRRVKASGSYRSGDELVVSNRSRDGDPGFWVLTPLVLDDGSVLAVARGFLYRGEFSVNGLSNVLAPAGRVDIEGVLQASPSGGRFGEERWERGRVPAVSQPDTAALDDRWGGAVLPLWLRLDAGTGAPAEAGPLVPIPPPSLSRGPHLSYAVQWFIFGGIALIGYLVILTRRAQFGSLRPDDPGHD